MLIKIKKCISLSNTFFQISPFNFQRLMIQKMFKISNRTAQMFKIHITHIHNKMISLKHQRRINLTYESDVELSLVISYLYVCQQTK